MPNTAKWSLPYPASSDQPHGPNAIRDVGLGIENNGLPILGNAADLASIPATSVGVGRTFFAQNTGQLFVSDGFIWAEIWMPDASDLSLWRDFPGQLAPATLVVVFAGSYGATNGLYYMDFRPNGAGVFANGGTAQSNARAMLSFDPADYAISGKTTQLRIEAILRNSQVSTGITFTVGLHPWASNNGAYHPVPNGNATASGTVAITAGSSNTFTRALGTPFTIPTAGPYMMLVKFSAPTAASSKIGLAARIQMRYV